MKFLPARCALLFSVLLALGLSSCATRGPASGAGVNSRDEALKLQIFLDSQGFGVGMVDGRAGEFTTKAATLYQQSRGLPVGSPLPSGHIQPYANYTVTEEDFRALGNLASEPEARSKQEKLPYTTLLELLGERFHTSQQYLRELNPTQNINLVRPGAQIIVPNVARPFRYEAFPSTYPAPSAVVAGRRQVIVNLQQKNLQVLDQGRTIAAFPITPGSPQHPAPAGLWRVVGSVPWPWYRHDEGVLSRGERTDEFYNLPPGPNSPVGILWAGLNRPGVGIHGSPVPETIGRTGSHGCIRLTNWDAAIFHTLISKNTPVTIR
ncbi:L,D-transpeptidase family protein [Verrucomicrobiaceae bacterium 227]